MSEKFFGVNIPGSVKGRVFDLGKGNVMGATPARGGGEATRPSGNHPLDGIRAGAEEQDSQKVEQFSVGVQEHYESRAETVIITGGMRNSFTLYEPHEVVISGGMRLTITIVTENPDQVVLRQTGGVRIEVTFKNSSGETLPSPKSGESAAPPAPVQPVSPTQPSQEPVTYSGPGGSGKISIGKDGGGNTAITGNGGNYKY